MNRGLTIAGAVMMGSAVLIPLLFMMSIGDSFGDIFGAIIFMVVFLPIIGIVGLVGLILLIAGLASGDGNQQQQQQVVITSGGMAICPNGHETQPGIRYCTACGVPIHG